MSIAMAKAKKRGRPKGSRTQKLPVQQHTPDTTCPRCGSVEREPYNHTVTKTLGKKTYTWRRTRCTACNQGRIDKSVRDS